MLATVNTRNARFCDDDCRKSFQIARDAGTVYPVVWRYDVPSGTRKIGWVTHEEHSAALCVCAYCGEPTDGDPTSPNWRPM